MPVKKRTSKVRAHRITAEAVAAFNAGDRSALHFALGVGPWVPSPLDVHPDEPSPWPPGTGGAEYWPLAVELRRELFAAGAKMPTRGRHYPSDSGAKAGHPVFTGGSGGTPTEENASQSERTD